MKAASSILICALLLLTLATLADVTANCFTKKSSACRLTERRVLPTSVEEFLELREQIGRDPHGGAVLFVYALMARTLNPAIGNKLTVLSIAEDKLRKIESGGYYRGYSWDRSTDYHLERLRTRPHVIRSHAVGSSPENRYALDPSSVGLAFREQDTPGNDVETGRFKVFACSSGADTCRPITMWRNSRGFWKAHEFSTLSVDIRPPRTAEPTPAEEL